MFHERMKERRDAGIRLIKTFEEPQECGVAVDSTLQSGCYWFPRRARTSEGVARTMGPIGFLRALGGDLKDLAVRIKKVVAPERFEGIDGLCNTIHNDTIDLIWTNGGRAGRRGVII